MGISAQGFEFEDPAEEARLELMRGSLGAWREDRDAQLRMIDRLGLRAGDRFLELGCGPLQVGVPLIRYLDPGHYTGVDISADRLEAGRAAIARFGLDDRDPQLVQSNDFGLDRLSPASFDRIWCFQALIHFPQVLVERFMVAVGKLLEPGGKAWFSARVSPTEGAFRTVGSWLEFPVTEAGERFYLAAADAAGLDCTSLGTLGEWGLPSVRPGANNRLFQLRRGRPRAR